MDKYHETVLVEETVEALSIRKDGKYIDATLGTGGHTFEILEKGGKVLGIDADPAMIKLADERISRKFGQNDYKLINGNFTDIDKIADENGWNKVDGILFDLGVSNLHLKDLERGFSFENPEANLDMRLNPEVQGVKANDLLNVLREDQLANLFSVTMERGAAKWISGRVIHARNVKPINTVSDMLEIVKGLRTGKSSLNKATLPFLALRIAVNSELTNLETALPAAFELLDKAGRLVVISFHSGEDAIVKNFFREKAKEGAKILSERPIGAEEEELSVNRRSRSARMRVLEK